MRSSCCVRERCGFLPVCCALGWVLMGLWVVHGMANEPVQEQESKEQTRQERERREQASRWQQQIDVIEKLTRQGPDAKSLEQVLRMATTDEDDDVRSLAVKAIPFLGGTEPQITPFLKDKIPAVRLSAIQIILSMNGNVERIVPVLLEVQHALSAKKAEYRAWRPEETLECLNREGMMVFAERLLPLLRDKTFQYRDEAESDLGSLVQREKSIYAMARRWLDDDDERIRIVAMQAISLLYDDAAEVLPLLRQRLKTTSPNEEQAVVAAITNIESDLVKVRVHLRKSQQNGGAVNPTPNESDVDFTTQSILPDLIAAFRSGDEELNTNMMFVMNDRPLSALVKLGSKATEAVIPLLQETENPKLQVRAITVLGCLKTKPPEVVSKLAETLKSPNPEVRIKCAEVLGEMKKEGKSAVPGLIELLRGKEPTVRRAGANALGEIGEPAKEAIPELTQLLQDEWLSVRFVACRSLFKLGAKPEVFLPTMKVLLATKEKPRTSLINEFKGPRAGQDPEKEEEEEVIEGPRSEENDDELFLDIIRFAEEMGPAGKELAPQLIGLLGTRRMVSAGLGGFCICDAVPDAVVATGSASSIPGLLGCLKDENPQVRGLAVETLGKIKGYAPEVVAVLIPLLKDHAEHGTMMGCMSFRVPVRQDVVGALKSRGKEATVAVPALTGLLRDRDQNFVTEVIEALGEIGPGAKAAVPKLLKKQSEGEFRMQCAATLALAKIAPENEQALTFLRECLRGVQRRDLALWNSDDDFSQLCESVVVLGDRGKEFVPLVSALIETKVYLEVENRCAAAGAVARLEPGNALAMQYLKRMAESKDYSFQNAGRTQLRLLTGKEWKEEEE